MESTVPAQAPAAPVPETAPAKDKKSKRPRRLLWIALACIAVGGAGGGWFWYARASAAPKPEKAAVPTRAEAQYHALEPAFVVNLADADAVRYLQADVQLMTRDAATLAALERHGPALRNRLLLLFGQQTAQALSVRQGKEKLQQQALAEVRATLKAEGAPDKVEAFYFTSLVTQ